MIRKGRKYLVTITALALWGHLVFGTSLARVHDGSFLQPPPIPPVDVVVPPPPTDSTGVNLNAPSSRIDPAHPPHWPSQSVDDENPYDSITIEGPRRRDTTQNPRTQFLPDSFYPDSVVVDSLDNLVIIPEDSLAGDSIVRSGGGGTLDDIIYGNSKDSLVYKAKLKKVYIYEQGDIDYQNLNLKADYIEADLDTKIVIAIGREQDSTGVWSRPEFMEGGSVYTGDTLIYNLDSKIGKTKNAATQEGDGYIIGRDIKKMADNTVNIAGGKYTTCDHIDHPHFYLAMTKARLIPGKKVIIGPSYLVLEDVPIYFPLIPFGFFPVMSGPKSGFIMPSYGEESVKGFFIREGGYYFNISDYVDATVLGGYYTLGSWETSFASRYTVRYKFSGSLNARFTKDIIGEKGSEDYVNQNNFSLQWTHTQDPKFRPNSTFAASVNFSSSGYQKHGSNNMNDYLSTQTNSSISYSKTWAGKPFSLSMRFQHSQNSHDTTVALTFPDVAFNIQRIYPFKRKNPQGRERWYEKISMQYTGTMTNSVTVHERDLFTETMFKNMKSGINHTIPVSTSFNLFNYLNVSPSFNYNERWFFRKIEREWDPDTHTSMAADTTYGFYRLYNYNVSVSASTKVYGMFQFGENSKIKAIRHVMTPTISASWAPDFGDLKYGFYQNIQTDSLGTIGIYSPYDGNAYGVPSRGKQASLSFSLSNNLEMKVRSDRDTTGERKIKLIDDFRLSGSYNFLADEFKLSTISASLRTTIVKNLGLNINATFDPYWFNPVENRRENIFLIRKGKLARLTNASTSFGYSFNSSKGPAGAVNDINSAGLPTSEQDAMFQDMGTMDPTLRRMMMVNQYYDFDIPWNLGFSYSFSYSKPGLTSTVNQTLSFNGSVTPTPKWGINFSGGYDFKTNQLTPGIVSINRDLHCWTMSMSWVPVGYRKSWSFTIRVKSAVLQDLKYDKRNSYYDNIYN